MDDAVDIILKDSRFLLQKEITLITGVFYDYENALISDLEEF